MRPTTLTMAPIRLLLVDDQEIILDGLKALLDTDDRFIIAGLASDGREALEKARNLSPDVIVLDISMPVMDGIEAARALRAWRPDQRILMLSMYGHQDFVNELLDIGVAGYILKNAGRKELFQAIVTVASGFRYLAQEVKDAMDAPPTRPRKPGRSTMPSKREKEIIRMIVGERSTSQIAEVLGLSPNTVETHRKNILSKLGLHNSTGLVRYAMERGWMAT